MHNGAPANISVAVSEYLNDNFPDQWIGRGGTDPWLAKSPDLNSSYFYLWGHWGIDTVEKLRLRILNGMEIIK